MPHALRCICYRSIMCYWDEEEANLAEENNLEREWEIRWGKQGDTRI